jgi:hypothetical protein
VRSLLLQSPLSPHKLVFFKVLLGKWVRKFFDYTILLIKSKKDAHASLEEKDKKKHIKAIFK